MPQKYLAVLAIDFDGVIHDHKNPVDGKRMGKPMHGVDLEELYENGYKIIIHTANNVRLVSDWLQYYEMPYHEVTNIKPIADIYIDDKAYLFTDWPTLYRDLESRFEVDHDDEDD